MCGYIEYVGLWHRWQMSWLKMFRTLICFHRFISGHPTVTRVFVHLLSRWDGSCSFVTFFVSVSEVVYVLAHLNLQRHYVLQLMEDVCANLMAFTAVKIDGSVVTRSPETCMCCSWSSDLHLAHHHDRCLKHLHPVEKDNLFESFVFVSFVNC